jgi:RecA-family ATPase
MIIYDEKQKEFIYNWRKNNPDKFKEYMRIKCKEYYRRNREKILQQKKEKREKLKSQSSGNVSGSSLEVASLKP